MNDTTKVINTNLFMHARSQIEDSGCANSIFYNYVILSLRLVIITLYTVLMITHIIYTYIIWVTLPAKFVVVCLLNLLLFKKEKMVNCTFWNIQKVQLRFSKFQALEIYIHKPTIDKRYIIK